MSGLITYPDRDALMRSLAQLVEDGLRLALASKGYANLAVPGGTTPAPFFAYLRVADLDWTNINVLLTDERFVPINSPRSNTRFIHEHLLKDAASQANFISICQPAPEPELVLDVLTAKVAKALPLDICVLGMGVDMHTASLFPGADLLTQALADDAPILLPMRAAGAVEPRLTLSAPVLRSADQIHVLITGAEKKLAYERALRSGPVAKAPIRCVLHGSASATVHFAN